MTRPNDPGGGGMTGATGDLTPDDSDGPFIPAEQREISDSGSTPTEPDAAPEGSGGGTTPDESDGDDFSHREEHF